ncbi:hypothetical protein KUCAC02_026088, partial [Chaenocephalus aceratus]
QLAEAVERESDVHSLIGVMFSRAWSCSSPCSSLSAAGPVVEQEGRAGVPGMQGDDLFTRPSPSGSPHCDTWHPARNCPPRPNTLRTLSPYRPLYSLRHCAMHSAFKAENLPQTAAPPSTAFSQPGSLGERGEAMDARVGWRVADSRVRAGGGVDSEAAVCDSYTERSDTQRQPPAQPQPGATVRSAQPGRRDNAAERPNAPFRMNLLVDLDSSSLTLRRHVLRRPLCRFKSCPSEPANSSCSIFIKPLSLKEPYPEQAKSHSPRSRSHALSILALIPLLPALLSLSHPPLPLRLLNHVGLDSVEQQG